VSVAWKIRLAAQAVVDFSDIVTWTAQTFGERQAETYAETLTLAIETLHHGPEQLGSKARDDIMPGIRTLHVARHGRSGRHFVVYREASDQCIDILRLLHDNMDLARHVPAADNRR
jgi:toxin ParE1/3/4